jgi:hypothetical protein
MRRVAAAIILAVCVGAPIVELFDHWDHTLNDTEANVVIAALCVGVGLAVATTVAVARIRASLSAFRSNLRPVLSRPLATIPLQLVVPAPTTSPPIALRI